MNVILAVGIILLFYFIASTKTPYNNAKYRKPAKYYTYKPTNTFYYYNKKPILTYREKIFYRHLQQKVRSEFIIVPQAVISSFISCKYKKYRTKIDKKTVDFLIVNYEFEPVVAIELDDKSHLRPDRIERDRFVNQLMYDTNIKIARIEVGKSYINEIEQKLAEII